MKNSVDNVPLFSAGFAFYKLNFSLAHPYFSANMAFIGKIFLTIVALQLALVLAKPYEPYNVDLYNSNEPMDEYFHKREELGRRCLE